jgi:hypothetical protein
MNRNHLSISLIAALAAIFLAACGSSHKTVPPALMLAMNTPPPESPATIEIGLSVPLSASVVNDPSNGGIVWSLSCDQANCGTLSSSTSASGDTIVYTAPPTIPEADVPNGGMDLTVTATSGTDSTVFASATTFISVVSDASFLAGNYAFYVQGFDANGFVYTAAGSVALDGMGNVTGGEEDFFDSFNATPSVGDVITVGSIVVNQNGTGTLTVSVAKPTTPPTPDTSVGVGGQQVFSIVAVNNNHLMIEEFDAAATSIGSMDLQTFTASDLTQLSGGFAYTLSGVDSVGATLGFGGVFSTDGSGGFSNDQSDENDGGAVMTNLTGQGGSFTAPDVNGRGTSTIGSKSFAYYIVNPEALSIVETDGTQLAVGVALGQGSAAGTFSAAAIGGSVFTANGSTAPGLASIAGQIATDGTATFTGFADTNENGDIIATGSISGGYTLAADGYGNVTITAGDLIGIETDITTFGVYAVDPAVNVVDPNNPNQTGGALLLNLDGTGSMTGILSPQTDPTDLFNTNNALTLGGDDTTGPVNLIGQVLSDGVSNLTGTGDLNEILSAQTADVSLVGTFAPDGVNVGRSTLALTINGAATPNNIILYQASPSLSVSIDIDTTFQGSGSIQVQQ